MDTIIILIVAFLAVVFVAYVCLEPDTFKCSETNDTTPEETPSPLQTPVEKPTVAYLQTLTYSLVLKPNAEDNTVKEMIALYKQDIWRFSHWLDENLSRACLNLAVLHTISQDDFFRSALLDRLISPLTFEFHPDINWFELEKRLLSIMPDGTPNCGELLEEYLIKLRICGKDLDINLRRVIIRDKRFAKVRKLVEDSFLTIGTRREAVNAWLDLEKEDIAA